MASRRNAAVASLAGYEARSPSAPVDTGTLRRTRIAGGAFGRSAPRDGEAARRSRSGAPRVSVADVKVQVMADRLVLTAWIRLCESPPGGIAGRLRFAVVVGSSARADPARAGTPLPWPRHTRRPRMGLLSRCRTFGWHDLYVPVPLDLGSEPADLLVDESLSLVARVVPFHLLGCGGNGLEDRFGRALGQLASDLLRPCGAALQFLERAAYGLVHRLGGASCSVISKRFALVL